MADNKVDIDIIVNTANSAKSVGDLRKVMKDLSFAQEQVDKSSPDFAKLTASINDVEGRIGDLNDSFKTFTGSGVERLGSSMDLLSQSFNGLDLGKAKVGLEGLKQLPKALSGEIDGLSKAVSFSNLNFKSLGTGLKSLGDSGFGQLTKSIVSLGKAILTNPLLLLAAVIVGIVVAVVKFSDKIKPVKDIMDAIGEAIGLVVQKLKDFADWLGITSFAAEEAAQKQLDSSKKLQEDTAKRYDTEIKLAQAAGKDTFQIEKEKQAAVRTTIMAQIDALNKLAEINGELNDEQKKQLEELKDAYKDSLIETKVLDIKKSKEVADKEAKDLDDRKKKYESYAKERAAANADLNKQIEDQQIELIQNDEEREFAKAALQNERAKQNIEKSKADADLKQKALIEQELIFQQTIGDINDKYAKQRAAKEAEEAAKLKELKIADLQADDMLKQTELDLELLQLGENEAAKLELRMASLQAEKDRKIAIAQETGDSIAQINAEFAVKEEELRQEKIRKAEEDAAREKQLRQDTTNAVLDIAKGSADSLNSLADLVFTIKKTNLEKGSEAEKKAAEKEFKIKKALGITSAVISTIQGVINALTAQSVIPEPFGTVLKAVNAVAVGIAGAANIAKIASTQFNAGGGGAASAASPSVPSGSGGAAAATSAPTFQPPSFIGLGQGQQNSSNKLPDQKVVVTETDITRTQKKVSVIEDRARIN